MKEQINNLIKWIQIQNFNGCITGSCLLDYFEDQDVDVFVYDEASFTKLLFACHYDPMFQLLDPLEIWKFNEHIDKGFNSLNKLKIITIKFKYNLSIDFNIVIKKDCTNAFDVLSTFDMDIICKAYDIKSKQYLDLTNNADKLVSWNKWNIAYYDFNLWKITRLLRQIKRCFKYYDRGYNTDLVILKYKDLIRQILEYQSIFKSESFDLQLDNYKTQLYILNEICDTWLKEHTITEEENEILDNCINLI